MTLFPSTYHVQEPLKAVHLHIGARRAASLGRTALSPSGPGHDRKTPRKRRCAELIPGRNGIRAHWEDDVNLDARVALVAEQLLDAAHYGRHHARLGPEHELLRRGSRRRQGRAE